MPPKREYLSSCEDCRRERAVADVIDYGLFGVDFKETKKIMRKLLAPHGLKLRVRKGASDVSTVWLEHDGANS